MNTLQAENIRMYLLPALRSGTYRQGRNFLRLTRRDDNAKLYCCLGVACDLYDPLAWDSDNYFNGEVDTLLPVRVQGFYGLNDSGDFEIADPTRVPQRFKDMASLGSLVELNDNGTPFDEIAAFIEWALNNPSVVTFTEPEFDGTDDFIILRRNEIGDRLAVATLPKGPDMNTTTKATDEEIQAFLDSVTADVTPTYPATVALERIEVEMLTELMLMVSPMLSSEGAVVAQSVGYKIMAAVSGEAAATGLWGMTNPGQTHPLEALATLVAEVEARGDEDEDSDEGSAA